MARFLTYLIAALQTIPGLSEAEFGTNALAMLRSPQPPPISAILTSLINEITALPLKDGSPDGEAPGSRALALVLDDYYLIRSQQIHDALTFMLDHLPPQKHLVIARGQPCLRQSLRGRVRHVSTSLRTRAGRHHRAVASCQEALRLVTGREDRRLPVAGYALVYLGGVYREWNDLETAAHCLVEGIDLCAQVGYVLDQIVGHTTLARVRQAQGKRTPQATPPRVQCV